MYFGAAAKTGGKSEIKSPLASSAKGPDIWMSGMLRGGDDTQMFKIAESRHMQCTSSKSHVRFTLESGHRQF
jgi:hypothetical protein